MERLKSTLLTCLPNNPTTVFLLQFALQLKRLVKLFEMLFAYAEFNFKVIFLYAFVDECRNNHFVLNVANDWGKQ